MKLARWRLRLGRGDGVVGVPAVGGTLPRAIGLLLQDDEPFAPVVHRGLLPGYVRGQCVVSCRHRELSVAIDVIGGRLEGGDRRILLEPRLHSVMRERWLVWW